MINGMINVGKTMRFNQQQWWFLDGICVYHVVKTMPFLPAMTGNGKHTILYHLYIYGDWTSSPKWP